MRRRSDESENKSSCRINTKILLPFLYDEKAEKADRGSCSWFLNINKLRTKQNQRASIFLTGSTGSRNSENISNWSNSNVLFNQDSLGEKGEIFYTFSKEVIELCAAVTAQWRQWTFSTSKPLIKIALSDSAFDCIKPMLIKKFKKIQFQCIIFHFRILNLFRSWRAHEDLFFFRVVKTWKVNPLEFYPDTWKDYNGFWAWTPTH